MIVRAVQWGALALAVLFVVLCLVTIGMSVARNWRERRRRQLERRLRPQILRNVVADDPDWNAQAASFSRREQSAARRVIERLLRDVRGSDSAALFAAARAFGMGSIARERFVSGSPVERKLAANWLALTDHPVTATEILQHATGNQGVREAAARIFVRRQEEFAGASEWGTRLLVWEGDEVLSVHGVDTLYRLNNRGATALLTTGHSYVDSWDPDLTIQVLTVLAKSQLISSPTGFRWIIALTRHDEPTIRAAAFRVFTQLGWNDQVREHAPIEAGLADPEPVVRRATYGVLAGWGDAESRDRLVAALETETNDRARLDLCRTLARHGYELPEEGPYWRWATASLRAASGTRERTPEALLA